MPLPIIHHLDYDAASVADAHRFPMRKYSYVAKRAQAAGFDLVRPQPAGADMLQLVHGGDYVRSVLACSMDTRAARRIGFAMTGAIAARSCAAVGGTVLAARQALVAGAAVNLAGGSHHADRDGGAGFCVFNDVAVAAEELIKAGHARRILIVDFDVHQGDGTARIFARREDVFTFSMHCQDNWPIEKPPSDLDIGLNKGADDAAYLAAAAGGLAQSFGEAVPDFVFYNAGVDPHRDDRLGQLALSDEGLAARDELVVSTCARYGVPVCGVLGGGYSHDADAVARRHMFLIEAMAGMGLG